MSFHAAVASEGRGVSDGRNKRFIGAHRVKCCLHRMLSKRLTGDWISMKPSMKREWHFSLPRPPGGGIGLLNLDTYPLTPPLSTLTFKGNTHCKQVVIPVGGLPLVSPIFREERAFLHPVWRVTAVHHCIPELTVWGNSSSEKCVFTWRFDIGLLITSVHTPSLSVARRVGIRCFRPKF